MRPVEPDDTSRPAPPKGKNLFFDRPGIFTAWGLKSGSLHSDTFVAECADAGLKWIAVEVSDPANLPSDDVIEQTRASCHARGLSFGTWELNPENTARVDKYKPDFWILNVESPGNYVNVIKDFRKKYPKLPTALVTNCDIGDPKPWLSANVRIMPEAYVVDNPQATPENMVYESRKLGWTYVFPTFGVYGGFPLAHYASSLAHLDGWNIYLAEEMTTEDWATLHSWKK